MEGGGLEGRVAPGGGVEEVPTSDVAALRSSVFPCAAAFRGR